MSVWHILLDWVAFCAACLAAFVVLVLWIDRRLTGPAEFRRLHHSACVAPVDPAPGATDA